MPKGSLAIICPECRIEGSRVLDSRANETGIRRRRECSNGHRFTTQEILLDEWQTQIEEAVDGVVSKMIKVAESERDRYRNSNRG